MEIDDGDYQGVWIYLIYFIQTFENGIGNMAPPLYNNWIERKSTHMSSVPMIYMIWFIWGLD